LRRHGDVLKLERDRINRAGKLRHRVEIVERRLGLPQRHVGCRRVMLRSKDVDAVAQPRGSHRKHAAKLAAAKHAERGAGKDGLAVEIRHSA
jgi:hypothetical protein